MSGKSGSGGNDVNDFIFELEKNAKRIIKEANRRKREEELVEKKNAKRAAALAPKVVQKAGSVLVTAGKTITSAMGGNSLESSAGATSRKIWEDGAAATTAGAGFGGTQVMRYSVPKMQISMSTDTINFGGAGGGGLGAGEDSHRKRPSSAGLKKGADSSILSLDSSPSKESAVLGRLKKSPYVTEGTGSIDEILANKKTHLDIVNSANQVDAPPVIDSNWQLRTKAAEILGGKQQSGIQKFQHKQLVAKSRGTKKNIEAQGPTDWSCNGLKSKYRGEVERESAWQAWQAANNVSTQTLEEQNIVLPVAKVHRHPVCGAFDKHLYDENVVSCTRTKARMLMKRFVFDVHELWLTNLQHLKEHHPSKILSRGMSGVPGTARSAGSSSSRRSAARDFVATVGTARLEEEEGEGDADDGDSANFSIDASGNPVKLGLKGRRDSNAVKGLESQIQSVSQQRSLKRAYYTGATQLLEPEVTLDYVPAITADVIRSVSLPSDLESLVFNVRLPVVGSNRDVGEDYAFVFIDRLIPVEPLRRLKSPPRKSKAKAKHVKGEEASSHTHSTQSQTLSRHGNISSSRSQQEHEDHNTAHTKDSLETVSTASVQPVTWRVTALRAYDNYVCELSADETAVVDYLERLSDSGKLAEHPQAGLNCVYSSDDAVIMRVLKAQREGAIVHATVSIHVSTEPAHLLPPDEHSEVVPSIAADSTADAVAVTSPAFIRIECRATLRSSDDDDDDDRDFPFEMRTQTSAVELNYLLQPTREALGPQGVCNFRIPENQVSPSMEDTTWWFSEERVHDLWPEVVDLLQVCGGEGELDEHGHPTLPTLSLSFGKAEEYRSGNRIRIIHPNKLKEMQKAATKLAAAVGKATKAATRSSAPSSPPRTARSARTTATTQVGDDETVSTAGGGGNSSADAVPRHKRVLDTRDAMHVAEQLVRVMSIKWNPASPSESSLGRPTTPGSRLLDLGELAIALTGEEDAHSVFRPTLGKPVQDSDLVSAPTMTSAAVMEQSVRSYRAVDDGGDLAAGSAGMISRRPTSPPGGIGVGISDEGVLTEVKLGGWEEALEANIPNLSLRASAVVDRMTLVPGSCAMGRRRIWFADTDDTPYVHKIAYDKKSELMAGRQGRDSRGSSRSSSRPQTAAGGGGSNRSSRPQTAGSRPSTGDSPGSRPRTSDRLRGRIAAAAAGGSGLEVEFIEVDENARFQPEPFSKILVSDGRYTQVGANFFRDANISSTDSVLVYLTLALDAPTLFGTVLSWENDSSMPPRWPVEHIEGIVPEVAAQPVALLETPLVNPLETRLSLLAMVFSTTPLEGVDHVPLEAAFKPKGMVRHWPFRGFKGFRRKIEAGLLAPDASLPTIVFGITTIAVTPNTTGVNTRNVWHATLPITELVNRPRVSKDYVYILITQNNRGPNEPTHFTVRMRSGNFIGLTSSAFENYEKLYDEIKQRRDAFQRQLALDIKIEASELALKAKEKEMKVTIQKNIQLSIEKKLRKLTKSEKGWRRRFASSIILEIQNNWERRMDANQNLIFFHCVQDPRTLVDPDTGEPCDENYLKTCQWEVPPYWDGDPLSTAVHDDGASVAERTVELARSRSRQGSRMEGTRPPSKMGMPQQVKGDQYDTYAFEQPPESWIPANGAYTARGPPTDLTRTPGTRTTTFNRGADMVLPSQRPRTVSAAVDSTASVYADSVVDSLEELSLAGGSDVGGGGGGSIDTANLEHIAEQLVASDELMRVIARRLGLPESQIVSVDDLSSVFSVDAGPLSDPQIGPDGRPMAPRIVRPQEDSLEIRFGDEDEEVWSDDEIEAGDMDTNEHGLIVNNPLEAAQARRKELRDIRGETERDREQKARNLEQAAVPFLDLEAQPGLTSKDSEDPSLAWRKLPRAQIAGSKFFGQCDATRTMGGDPTTVNTFNMPIYLTPISPVDACVYYPEPFGANIESIFIPNARTDMERASATLERNIRREEDMSAPVNTEDLIRFGEVKELTTADALIARQYREDLKGTADPRDEAIEKAVRAAKSNNVAMMEDALEEDIQIDTTDNNGNSLFMISAQQNSKRMCKFLLRRGANINFQSTAGNTALHFCYAFDFKPLAEYLKSKGADDSILNREGLTCYEGCSMEQLV